MQWSVDTYIHQLGSVHPPSSLAVFLGGCTFWRSSFMLGKVPSAPIVYNSSLSRAAP